MGGHGGRGPIPDFIVHALRAEGDVVPFARFMELALGHSRSGYYSSGAFSLGPEGDFTTAPHRAPGFNRAVARAVGGLAAELRETGQAVHIDVFEPGSGAGDLAAGVLTAWAEEWPELRDWITYHLVDLADNVSEDNKAVLAALEDVGWQVCRSELTGGPTRAAECGPGVPPRTVGIIVSNEFLDALPVHVVDVRSEGVREAWVALRGAEDGALTLEEEWRGPCAAARAELQTLFGTIDADPLREYTRDGVIELRPGVRDFLEWAGHSAHRGFMLTIDYGDWLCGPPVSSENVRSSSPAAPVPPGSSAPSVPHARSLRTFFRHQRTDDPYVLIGRQDITADVDFRALALHGSAGGWECLSYSSLAAFLRATDPRAEEEGAVPDLPPTLDADREASVFRALRDEEDVGGLFKVMLQVRE